ncbi:hypothetical protein [Cellulomonas sp. IC4_254]|uniref:hypothetical protein n=1 Tax=Cellulomonas sp. IC4_254 TaxID=2714040 RepID=UPI00141F456D|nr:hypothetical protein [Cellulomonas sp. IC4_254]NHT16638.1 hypothetical protein [Cellulomonas sp. IC4_254]
MSADTAVAPVERSTASAALDADARPGQHGAEREAADPGRPGREAAWVAALAEMELGAERAEELLAGAQRAGDPQPVDVALTAPWRTPRGLGPLPASLAPRAAALVERQRDLARRTGDQLAEHRRRLRTTDGLRTRPAPAPAYLDVEG